jgi:uroporphyrinogen decarboxylase
MIDMMTGKELLLRTLDHEVAPRAPWVPFAGVHAGSLKGFSARETLSDADKLVESLLEVNRLYSPDGQPILFDLQIEAEALGCDLLWSDKAPPSVSSHPLLGSGSLPEHIPGPGEGRIALAIEATRRMKAAVGDRTALYGIVTGPLTLASHLRSTELFMDLILEPEYAARLIDYSFRVETAVAGYYADAGADVIAVVDPLVSQISPAHFEEFLQKPYADFFSRIRARGLRSSFFVCGNATHNLEPMCRTRPDCISVDENVSMRDAKKITNSYNVCLGGNIQLTVAMLFGSQADNMKAVIDILDDCGEAGNLIVSPGCDMPYDVPVENAIAASLAAREPGQARAMLVDYRRTDLPMDVELPDYSCLKKPIVEVFTLDSDTCAACGYMMETAKGIKAQFGERIDLVEYKFTSLENIARCRKMEVKNLPSIYLNGILAYSSIIPSRKDLAAKVESLL